MSIYEMIRDHMDASVPFAKVTGVELVEVSPERGVARLKKRPDVENHIQTMHAGAMFTLGEAASGAALGGVLGDQLMAARPVAADASIKYLKTGKTDLTATATANSDAEAIRQELEEVGKVVFDINVAITDAEGVTVAEMVVNWHVKKTG
ncbi:YiiD C-terminal domain-containing protein [Oceanicaulis sp. MMSF_3324]|uniref:YiiD C-terminal domain-containing protein n=1 Tax=Oceanicaulis sp. MMSF_3324 TaxID=3046702 RepID=UPI00273D0D78|nr:YiiD C-terminal domain-containing protein [Oceanicaulis sp. MMSF_3324]